MFEHSTDAKLRCASISLEDGADEAYCDGEPIKIGPRGMHFTSHWWFSPGTTLAMTLDFPATGRRSRAEGLVVACDQTGHRRWSVTVLFLEAPTDFREEPESRTEKDFQRHDASGWNGKRR